MAETIVIFSSPHQDSYTKKQLNKYLTDNSIIDYWIYDCYKNEPHSCIDCKLCEKEFNCVFNDLYDFYKEFLTCKSLIIAFPVYNGSFPAPLKAFIDRMQIYFNEALKRRNHLHTGCKKKTTLIFSSGANIDYTNLILEQIKPMFTVTDCTLKKIIFTKGTDGEKAITITKNY